MKEIWKPCQNVKGLYEVSSLGRVRNGKTKIVLKPSFCRGYAQVHFSGKTHKVHRLVAQAFLENPKNLSDVNHKNGIKSDNCVENLEWCSRLYNQRHFNVVIKKHKFCSRKNTRLLCVETGDVFLSTKDFERKTGRCSAAIRRVLCGQAQTSCGYHWKYTDKEPTNIDASKYKKQNGCDRKIAERANISAELYSWRKRNGWSLQEIFTYKPNLANKFIRNGGLSKGKER